MDNLKSWSDEDEAIIATNTDASECKRCAVELGYWRDDYIRFFVRRAERKPPEINRGYYARVRAVELFVHQFLERVGSQCQIINLGCGFDTLFWRLKDTTRAVGNFIELDFPTVTNKKSHIIKRNKQLLEKIANEDGEVVLRSGDLHSDGYHLVGCDLRAPGEVSRALAAAAARVGAPGEGGLPAMLLAECVLVYLRPEQAEALLRQLSALFPSSLLLLYEQCNLDDKFGQVMMSNLGQRGCSVAGWARCGGGGAAGGAGAEALAARLGACGWARAAGWDMTRVWAALPAEDRARVQRLEPLDESELLQQLHRHYALTLAAQGDLCADLLDLSALAC